MIGVLVLVTITETARLYVPSGRALFGRFFGGMLREKEAQHFSGVFWMALGVFSVAVLIAPFPLFASVLLYLLLGDTAASLVGKSWPSGPRLFGTPKSIAGSAACFVTCVLIGFFVVRPVFGWPAVWVGAAAATAAEANPFSIDDNFFMPFVSALAFLLFF
jgi:dolichol kinase